MRKGRPVYEIIVVAIAVGLAIVLGAALAAGRARVEKNHLLLLEMGTLRRAVRLFTIVNKAPPQTLEELAASTYGAGEESHPFLDPVPKMKGGRIIDPFGRPYRYDSKSGWVSSATPGYERW